MSIGSRLLLLAALAMPATPACADAPAKPGKPGETQSAPQAGKKWQTDAAVRQGMEMIHKTMTARHEDILKEKITVQDYRNLGQAVDQALADMLKKRQLSPDADTAFHGVVLNDLKEGIELMRTATKLPAQRIGAMGVLQSLRNYGAYFEHPMWPAEAAKTHK